MPKLVRLYLLNCLYGFAAAIAFTGLLLGFDVGHLRHLVTTSDVGMIAGVMLVVFNGIVFSGVQFGIAVMRMADDQDPPRGRMQPEMLPIPVRVDERRQR